MKPHSRCVKLGAFYSILGPLVNLFFVGSGVLLLNGCGTATARERMEERRASSRAHPAAYDSFVLDHRMPEQRPQRAWEFYYKHCTLVSRNPYPERSEYECTSPH